MGDAATVLTTARWSEDTYYLKEFVHKFKLPQVAKVLKKFKLLITMYVKYLNRGIKLKLEEIINAKRFIIVF